MTKAILIAGGYGLVGSHVARNLRSLGFDGELGIAGRHPMSASDLAEEVGASLHVLDTSNPDSTRAVVAGYDVVLAALKDPTDVLLDAAIELDRGFVGITQSPDSVSSMLFRAQAETGRSAIVTLGHWQAGMALHAARLLIDSFRAVHAIEITALFDRADPCGPMATADAGDYLSRALIRRDREWRWVEARENGWTAERPDGDPFGAIPMSVLDTVSLAALTGANDVRFGIGVGQSRGTAAGGRASHEIYFDVRGVGQDGEPLAVAANLSNPGGQAHLTSLGLVAAAQALLEAPCLRGWQPPEAFIDPARAIEQAIALGADWSGPMAVLPQLALVG